MIPHYHPVRVDYDEDRAIYLDDAPCDETDCDLGTRRWVVSAADLRYMDLDGPDLFLSDHFGEYHR